jgi:hypothetical protein
MVVGIVILHLKLLTIKQLCLDEGNFFVVQLSPDVVKDILSGYQAVIQFDPV